ncbi:MAG: YggT family protein [Tepidanaerobacteraceae bacterium]|nr:YggT family protein [Tepidanaerobacteraceae bacterium]
MLLIRTIDLFFRVMEFLIIARVFMSWLPGAEYWPIYRFVYQITEPLLAPFRHLFFRFLPPAGGFYFDFSPVLALIAMDIVKNVAIVFLLRVIY